VEALGQNMLMMLVFVAMLALTLLLPVAIGGGVFLLLHGVVSGWAAIPATILVLGIIGFEAALLVDWLGGVFERTDPAAAGIG
jgi:hypothetical protein